MKEIKLNGKTDYREEGTRAYIEDDQEIEFINGIGIAKAIMQATDYDGEKFYYESFGLINEDYEEYLEDNGFMDQIYLMFHSQNEYIKKINDTDYVVKINDRADDIFWKEYDYIRLDENDEAVVLHRITDSAEMDYVFSYVDGPMIVKDDLDKFIKIGQKLYYERKLREFIKECKEREKTLKK